jgi:hypothetical protein
MTAEQRRLDDGAAWRRWGPCARISAQIEMRGPHRNEPYSSPGWTRPDS